MAAARLAIVSLAVSPALVVFALENVTSTRLSTTSDKILTTTAHLVTTTSLPTSTVRANESSSTSKPSTNSSVITTLSPTASSIVPSPSSTSVVSTSPPISDTIVSQPASITLQASSSHGFSTGAILGMAVGACAVIAALVMVVILRRRLRPPRELDCSPHISEFDSFHSRRGPHVAIKSSSSSEGPVMVEPAGSNLSSTCPDHLVHGPPAPSRVQQGPPSPADSIKTTFSL
ncbi:hypothetical protein Ae201684P_010782 [Aphanomyces euteiches]|uniref:Uncharacterized protein n=1 Tax=Aphanomyces euteiches TaxID=100861 RepID=A0A6G0WI08_9STRA|nr:hypothetical protein Ae201684_014978 [Aphanomyces euteiches]KAH9076851.1 hypothetical protein Ae201684P_010782 [Aphanomyces euteiches]